MQLNEKYKMEIVILEKTTSGIGDCCDCLETFQKEHPSSGFIFGYVIIDKETGYIPDGCKDWHKTPEAAMLEFMSKIMKKHDEVNDYSDITNIRKQGRIK